MITVHTEKYGVFNCKPLAFIWAKFPEFYSHKNTIMFDDLRRNFVMNPQNGLKIRPFDNAHTHRCGNKGPSATHRSWPAAQPHHVAESAQQLADSGRPPRRHLVTSRSQGRRTTSS